MSQAAEDNVRQLQDGLDTAAGHLSFTGVRLRDFWAQVKELKNLIRTLAPLPTAERQRVRSELDDLCQKAKGIQEDMDNDSRVKRELVESKIEDARRRTKGDAADLREARTLLNEALEWMKNGWSGFNAPTQLTSFSPGRMNRQDHDACWKQWQEVNESIGWKRRELGDLNYDTCKSDAMEASGNAEISPKLAKEQVKSLQQKMKGMSMSRDQFDEIHHILDSVWQRALHTTQQRHDEWRDRMLGQIEKKQELIERSEELISRLEDQIDACREQEANARTEEFADRVRGWIEEKTEIIRSKERFKGELRDQIREIEGKLN